MKRTVYRELMYDSNHSTTYDTYTTTITAFIPEKVSREHNEGRSIIKTAGVQQLETVRPILRQLNKDYTREQGGIQLNEDYTR